MLCVGIATEVRVFEKNGVGVLVFTPPQGNTRIMISSLAAGSFQGITIGPPQLGVDEIVSTLAESYVLKTRDYSPAAIARQIEQAGVKLSLPAPPLPSRPRDPKRAEADKVMPVEDGGFLTANHANEREFDSPQGTEARSILSDLCGLL